MSMDIDANSLLAGMLVSSIGFVLFVYGKKQSRFPQLVVGLVLMVYPYFVPSALLMFGIAVCLLGLLWLGVRAGY
jgi:hypothetical protein